MAAMRRYELFRDAAGSLSFEHPYRGAWFAMSHLWFVTGMELQEDRQKEVSLAMLADRWYSLSAADAAWMAELGPFSDEQAADRAAAKLWLRLDFPEQDRPRL